MAIVGSREAPEDALTLIEDLGEALCDDGIAITSGDADGCDRRGVLGAMRSECFSYIGVRVYLPWDGVRYLDGTRRWADNHHYFDASQFENWTEAGEIALKARGSFAGLKRGGIALHTRNPYQILLDDLRTPVGGVVCWARPVGKKGNVKGGTNTAVQIALDWKRPVINLATDEGLERAINYLLKKGKRS